MRKKIILASTSPRRKGLLQQIKLDFQIVKTDYEENMEIKMDNEKLVMMLAEGKANSVAKKQKEGIIIGVDTFFVFENERMGKSNSDEESYKRLKKMSGKYAKVYSGICIIDLYENKKINDYEITKIKFKELEEDEIKKYIETSEHKEKAGSIAIQERGAIFIEKIEGCYSNIVGLPLYNLYKNLKKMNINIFDYQKGKNKVLVAGTFDIFHLGHLYFFKEAKKYGDELIVIVGSDFIIKKNGKKLVHNQKERTEIIKNLKIVDKVILGKKNNVIDNIKKIKPNLICIGYDQKIPKEIETFCKENKIKIKRIKKKYNEEKCKSSIIKKRILSEE
jgi:septum formation protein